MIVLSHGPGYVAHGHGYVAHGPGYVAHGPGYVAHGPGYVVHGPGFVVLVKYHILLCIQVYVCLCMMVLGQWIHIAVYTCVCICMMVPGQQLTEAWVRDQYEVCMCDAYTAIHTRASVSYHGICMYVCMYHGICMDISYICI